MVNREKTIAILNKEAVYEDNLVKSLTEYCRLSKENITDIPEEKKNQILELLEKIRKDSERHERMIRDLIDYALNKGDVEY